MTAHDAMSIDVPSSSSRALIPLPPLPPSNIALMSREDRLQYIMHRKGMIIPSTSQQRRDIVHREQMLGHYGQNTLYHQLIKKNCWWPGMCSTSRWSCTHVCSAYATRWQDASGIQLVTSHLIVQATTIRSISQKSEG